MYRVPSFQHFSQTTHTIFEGEWVLTNVIVQAKKKILHYWNANIWPLKTNITCPINIKIKKKSRKNTLFPQNSRARVRPHKFIGIRKSSLIARKVGVQRMLCDGDLRVCPHIPLRIVYSIRSTDRTTSRRISRGNASGETNACQRKQYR